MGEAGGTGRLGTGEAAPLVGEDAGEGFEPPGDGPANIGRSHATDLLPEVREDAAYRPGVHLVGGQMVLKPPEAVGDGLEASGTPEASSLSRQPSIWLSATSIASFLTPPSSVETISSIPSGVT